MKLINTQINTIFNQVYDQIYDQTTYEYRLNFYRKWPSWPAYVTRLRTHPHLELCPEWWQTRAGGQIYLKIYEKC